VKGIAMTSSACILTTCLLFHQLSHGLKEPIFLFLFILQKIFIFVFSSALGRKDGKANEFQSQIGGNCDWNSLARWKVLTLALEASQKY